MRYLRETTYKASHDSDIGRLRWADGLLRDKALVDINRDMLEKVIAAKLHTGVMPASVNRVLQLIRAILRKAANEWEWLDRVPSFRFPSRRVRFLTQDQAERLIATLPAHLAAMARFSLETGLRQANVSGLQWSQVDLWFEKMFRRLQKRQKNLYLMWE